jgi:prepilin-type processing-associated H-X9-DG protein
MATLMYANDWNEVLPTWASSSKSPINYSAATPYGSWLFALPKYVGINNFDASRVPGTNRTARYYAPLRCPLDVEEFAIAATSTRGYEATRYAWPTGYSLSLLSSLPPPWYGDVAKDRTLRPRWALKNWVKTSFYAAGSFVLFAENAACYSAGVGRYGGDGTDGSCYAEYFDTVGGETHWVTFRHGPQKPPTGLAQQSYGKMNAGFLDGHVKALSYREFRAVDLSETNARKIRSDGLDGLYTKTP